MNTLLPLLVTRLIDRPDDCTETSPPPLVTWISENESKLKYDGEEFDDRSVIDPPSRFHCTFAEVPRDASDDLLARRGPADVQAGLDARRHVDDLPGVACRRDLFENVRRERLAGGVFLVSTTGDAAEIVTSSVIEPISSFWSTPALKPVVITTFGPAPS